MVVLIQMDVPSAILSWEVASTWMLTMVMNAWGEAVLALLGRVIQRYMSLKMRKTLRR